MQPGQIWGYLAAGRFAGDRKSTRLNSSHSQISYAVFCLKKKKNYTRFRGTGVATVIFQASGPTAALTPVRSGRQDVLMIACNHLPFGQSVMHGRRSLAHL